MSELPKDIDTMQQLKNYWHNHGYNYTVDDFMKDYGVSERKTKSLLKDIDYIGITRRLSRNIEDVKREKFYNSEMIFSYLVNNGKIIFKHNIFDKMIYREKEDKTKKVYMNKNNVVTSRVISQQVITGARLAEFYYILQHSATLRESAETAGMKLTDTLRKKLNRNTKRLEGFEIEIGGVKKYYPFDLENDKTDHKIILRILESIHSFEKWNEKERGYFNKM